MIISEQQPEYGDNVRKVLWVGLLSRFGNLEQDWPVAVTPP
jgi:hypothetical protein